MRNNNKKQPFPYLSVLYTACDTVVCRSDS
jgi:hypothetical protein